MSKKNFIPIAEPSLTGKETKYVLDCLESTWISSKGEYINLFEKEFTRFTGCKYGVSTSNGTTALHLAITALGIGSGDEVIVPNLTFIASANTVAYTGAKPVLVDVDESTWNIDPVRIEQAITKRTKAIMPVHLYGHPADMNRIMGIARKHKLLVIEDAAEAHGAEIKMNITMKQYNNVTMRGSTVKTDKPLWCKVGSIGNVGCFSFYGNKIITTGEGGMVTTNDRELAVKMRILRDHGQNPRRRYYHDVIGFNYRMTNIQAAIGLAQAERIRYLINKKRQNAGIYNHELSHVKGIGLPPEAIGTKNVFWLYSILVDKPYRLTRDELMDKLAKKGVETRPFFHTLHTMPPYFQKKQLAVSEYLAGHGLNLPSGVGLTVDQIKRIAGLVRQYSK